MSINFEQMHLGMEISWSHVQEGWGQVNTVFFFFFFFSFFFVFFAFSRAAPMAYGGSQARGLIGAAATGLRHSHSIAGSESCLQPTLQLTATPDP